MRGSSKKQRIERYKRGKETAGEIRQAVKRKSLVKYMVEHAIPKNLLRNMGGAGKKLEWSGSEPGGKRRKTGANGKVSPGGGEKEIVGIKGIASPRSK